MSANGPSRGHRPGSWPAAALVSERAAHRGPAGDLDGRRLASEVDPEGRCAAHFGPGTEHLAQPAAVQLGDLSVTAAQHQSVASDHSPDGDRQVVIASAQADRGSDHLAQDTHEPPEFTQRAAVTPGERGCEGGELLVGGFVVDEQGDLLPATVTVTGMERDAHHAMS